MVAFLVLGSKDNHSLIFAQLIFAQLIFFNGSEEVPAHFAWAFE